MNMMKNRQLVGQGMGEKINELKKDRMGNKRKFN